MYLMLHIIIQLLEVQFMFLILNVINECFDH